MHVHVVLHGGDEALERVRPREVKERAGMLRLALGRGVLQLELFEVDAQPRLDVGDVVERRDVQHDGPGEHAHRLGERAQVQREAVVARRAVGDGHHCRDLVHRRHKQHLHLRQPFGPHLALRRLQHQVLLLEHVHQLVRLRAQPPAQRLARRYVRLELHVHQRRKVRQHVRVGHLQRARRLVAQRHGALGVVPLEARGVLAFDVRVQLRDERVERVGELGVHGVAAELDVAGEDVFGVD
mmetsp:Transcript_12866/g.34653  ORF Transcript_12866/g.34653 Transcript_12866/m.34653 type:complete len:240 (+) Transcript_12866:875-1594(+)